MTWNLPTILILLGVAIGVGVAIWSIIKNRKKGCCNGDCAHCKRRME